MERRRGRVRSQRLGTTRGRLGERIDRPDHAGPHRLRHLGHDRVDVDDRPDARRIRGRSSRTATRARLRAARRGCAMRRSSPGRLYASGRARLHAGAGAEGCLCVHGKGVASWSKAMRADTTDKLHALADLIVRFGANVQPGQIVSLSSAPGKEPLTRAIAEAAYKAGAKFVDLIGVRHLSQARPSALRGSRHARVRAALVRRAHARDRRAARREIALTGPVAPHVMDGVDPSLLGKDLLPAPARGDRVVNQRTTNWTAAPCPTAGLGRARPPGCRRPRRSSACGRRSFTSAGSTRTTRWPRGRSEWTADGGRGKARRTAPRVAALRGAGNRSDGRAVPSCQWHCARITTVDGIVHAPNLPTEEVFTTPDPARVDGHVRSTKPLFVSGVLITGLRVRFEGGTAVEIDADQGAGHATRAVQSAIRARPGSARWRSSTATAGSATSTRCSSTRCSTRTPRATSRSARGSTSPCSTSAIRSGSTAASSTSTS